MGIGNPTGGGSGAEANANPKLARSVEELVLRRISQDALVIPSMPTIAIQALQVLQRINYSSKDVASVLELDPVLAARTLRLANSAAFGASGKAVTLVEALTRIGGRGTKTLLIDAAAAKVFQSRDLKIAEAARQVWRHSIAVAMLARDLSALTGSKDSDLAYLVGLLHDVGKPIVATVLLEAERQVTELRGRAWIGSAEWVWVLKQTHRPVAVALAEKWGLPPQIVASIRECSEYDSADRGAVRNAVCFANALSKEAGYAPDDSDLTDAKALLMIGRSLLGIEESMVNSVVAGLKPKLERYEF